MPREAAVRQDLKSGLQITFIIGFDVLDEKARVPANSLLVLKTCPRRACT